TPALASAARVRAFVVGSMPRPVRTRISSCRISRSPASAPLMAGCPRTRLSAAPETLFSRTSTWKATSRFKSSLLKSFSLIVIISPIYLNDTESFPTLPPAECKQPLSGERARRRRAARRSGSRSVGITSPHNFKERHNDDVQESSFSGRSLEPVCRVIGAGPGAELVAVALHSGQSGQIQRPGWAAVQDRLGRFRQWRTRLLSAVTQRLRQPGASAYRRLLRGDRGGVGHQYRSRTAGGRAWARVVLLPERQG